MLHVQTTLIAMSMSISPSALTERVNVTPRVTTRRSIHPSVENEGGDRRTE